MIAELNDFAQAWWQWMAGMFWQVSLLIILITLLDMAIRRWAWPQVRYVLWGLVFIKLIIPPTWQMPTSIVSWIQPKVEEQISIQITPFEVTAENHLISVSNTPSQTQPTQSMSPAVTTEQPSWQAIILLTWFVGMMTFSLLLVIKMSRLPKSSKSHDGQSTPEWFNKIRTKTVQSLKLRKTPTVVFSKDIKSPAIYGILKPILLLPEGCLDTLSQEQTEHVLIHELYHLKRGDLLVHWFCLIIQVIYWFNPLLIWARRQMRHVCEICCDLSVANLLREKTTAYRNTLIATVRELLTESVEPSLGLLGVFEEPFKLVSRLRWLEKKTWGNSKQKIAATICTGLIMVLCVMPMAGLSQPSSQNNTPPFQTDVGSKKSNSHAVQDQNDVSLPMIYVETNVLEVDEGNDIDLENKWFAVIFPPNVQNSMHLIQGEINIGMNSYHDIEAFLEAMDTEPGVHILSTFQLAIDATKNEMATIVVSDPESGFREQLYITPSLYLYLTSQGDGVVQSDVILKICNSLIEGDFSGDETTANWINNCAVVKNGNTLVIRLSDNGNNIVYLFMTINVFNIPDETQANQLGMSVDREDPYCYMDYSDVDIRDLIKAISEITGKKFIVDDEVKGKALILAQPAVSFDEAYKMLELVLDTNGYAAVPSGDFIKITKK